MRIMERPEEENKENEDEELGVNYRSKGEGKKMEVNEEKWRITRLTSLLSVGYIWRGEKKEKR